MVCCIIDSCMNCSLLRSYHKSEIIINCLVVVRSSQTCPSACSQGYNYYMSPTCNPIPSPSPSPTHDLCLANVVDAGINLKYLSSSTLIPHLVISYLCLCGPVPTGHSDHVRAVCLTIYRRYRWLINLLNNYYKVIYKWLLVYQVFSTWLASNPGLGSRLVLGTTVFSRLLGASRL